ncbi:cell division protein DIVIC [Bacillus coahuilensis p1.1.43]|uniref:Cell division protein DIVIC n=1 Tax=Bacillus coahuilensis p1.1.43 TaxID=1150625 RepID=A0A147K4T9_9BACI|nr:septum formation initiator family protein [Bacillus coahuilensis]KUP04552.1 cell division protein DIVIC [Bacillus coahuilensis p1.1.43]
MSSRRNITTMQNDYVTYREQQSHKKSVKKKMLVRRLLVLFTLSVAIIGALANVLFSSSGTLQAKKEELQAQKEQLQQVESQQQMLEEEIIKLNDDEYIKKLARRDYFLSDEGEIIFTLPKDKEETSNP